MKIIDTSKQVTTVKVQKATTIIELSVEEVALAAYALVRSQKLKIGEGVPSLRHVINFAEFGRGFRLTIEHPETPQPETER